MKLNFTKMHGLGNDFMVIDAISQHPQLTKPLIAAWARRDTGVGFDQCLVIEASQVAGIDFFYRIFNADGNEVGQCGNGARCVARFVRHQGLTSNKTIRIATHTTQMQLEVHKDDSVTVAMTVPDLEPSLIPLLAPKQAIWYHLDIASHPSCRVHALSVGNPHAILIVNDVSKAEVATLGQAVSQHPSFLHQSNVSFMEILNPEHIRLRVYERGCGETRACGSAAVAAAAAGRLYHQLAATVTVSLPGGDLIVHWPETTGAISLRGPATFVYQGSII